MPVKYISDLSRTALPPDLDPCIPAFQLNNTVLSERHPDSSAYESLDATGKIVIQATPAYHLEASESADTHTSEDQDMNNVDHSSETSESQSIDINSIKINNYVHNDCEFLQIDIDEIATRGRENERKMVGERDRNREQGNNKSGRKKERKMDGGNEIGGEIERERERGNGKNGSEKRRKKERKSKMKKKKNERKSDSILMDGEEDSIALRMKRNERRINQQSDGDDDEDTSYEY